MKDTCGGVFVFGFIVGMFLIMGIVENFPEYVHVCRQAYKQGQIDYANGKKVYKLVKQEDGTIIWKKGAEND